ncbi:hypothetical protein [Brevundimonas sp.]|uniref:DUF7831 domain-containing protein n=1 Tax=Brevundimonas sp. TaxID=1871086 RepID=UPI002D66C6F6|nr:hypothetical protein [Brevundimonas sp.]HYD29218.1 hypothetical protein [Brevundimonas sp.]
MPLKAKQYITQQDVRRRRDCVFVFGDNDTRKGRGGQAHACRGEPNTIGVRLRKHAGDHPSACWTDEEFAENRAKIDEDVRAIRAALEAGKTVVFPKGGLGSGSIPIEEAAPNTARYLLEQLAALKAIPGAVAQAPRETEPV